MLCEHQEVFDLERVRIPPPFPTLVTRHPERRHSENPDTRLTPPRCQLADVLVGWGPTLNMHETLHKGCLLINSTSVSMKKLRALPDPSLELAFMKQTGDSATFWIVICDSIPHKNQPVWMPVILETFRGFAQSDSLWEVKELIAVNRFSCNLLDII